MKYANYRPRIIDTILREALKASGAVWLQGPKWCGKTWTASQIARSILMMQDPDESANYLQQAMVKPSLLLEGDTPRLIDEWQAKLAIHRRSQGNARMINRLCLECLNQACLDNFKTVTEELFTYVCKNLGPHLSN